MGKVKKICLYKTDAECALLLNSWSKYDYQFAVQFVPEFVFDLVQGDSLARGPKQIWEKYSRIWRNAFKCSLM